MWENMNIKYTIALYALSLPIYLYANEEPDTIIVSATKDSDPAKMMNRKASVGILGDIDYMDNPYNVTSYNNDTIKKQQTRTVGGFINKYDASVNVLGSDSYAVDLMTIRGIFVSPIGTSINGLQGMAGYHKIYSNGIDTIQVTKGPSAMLKGASITNAVGGDINLTTKRASYIPLTEFSLSHSSRERYGFNTDISRRFGTDQEWGVRLNSEYHDGDRARKKQDETASLNALAIDYDGERFRVSLDGMLNNSKQSANRGVLMGDDTKSVASVNGNLPSPPDGKINFDQRWIKNKVRDRMLMGRIEADLTDSVMVYGSIGYSKNFLSTPTMGNWFVTKNTDSKAQFGSFKPGPVSNFETNRKTLSSELGITGSHYFGDVMHQWSLAGNFTKYREDVGTSLYASPASCQQSTIYNVKDCKFDVGNLTPFVEINNKINSRFISIAAADRMTFWDDKIQTTIGLRHQQINNDTTSNGRLTEKQQSAITPTVGIVFKPIPSMSIYGNYIEALTQGDVAPINAKNAGELMHPYKSKQKEFGVKNEFNSWLLSAAVFEIEKASGFLDHDSLIYSANGKRQNRGLELNLSGEPIEGLRLASSSSWIRSKRIDYDKKGFSNNNTFPAPKFSSKLNVEWDIPRTNKLTILGSIVYTGKAAIDSRNFYTGEPELAKIPAWTRVDISLLSSLPNVLGKETNLQLKVENVFNKRYWNIGDFNDTNVVILDHAMPRMFSLTLTTKF